MRLLVYLRDARTVYMLTGRGLFAQLVGALPWGEHPSVTVQRGTWNPVRGEYVWAGVRLRFIAKGSISHVEEAAPGQEVREP